MSEWIPLLVRAEDYAEFATTVANREAGREGGQISVTLGRPTTAAAQVSSPADQSLSEYPTWPEAALKKLSTFDSATAQRWTKALDAISSDEKQAWFTTSEVAERAGMSVNEWRDAARKMPRHIKAHFPDVPVTEDGPAWPLLANSFTSAEVSWGMTADTRASWREVRGL